MSEQANLNEVYNEIKTYLDDQNNVKTSVIFASNTSGKTRLSRMFEEKYGEERALCYNAFLEDCFSWDNDSYTFTICDCWELRLINTEGIGKQIERNFERFANSNIKVDFNAETGNISFTLKGDNEYKDNIKISKGEESLFIWTVFYTILSYAIDLLAEKPEDRSSHKFDTLKYIIIDDPVSSMDDTRIITIALVVAELIEKIVNSDKLQIKPSVLITTHHTLFFNILHNKIVGKRKDYVLSRSNYSYILEYQDKDSPFAYHHEMLLEIQRAIRDDELKKYHFNMFRCLLEKTANFLGYNDKWSDLIRDNHNKELLTKLLNHYSHNSLSETEAKYVEENDKELFVDTFNTFLRDYKWKYEETKEVHNEA